MLVREAHDLHEEGLLLGRERRRRNLVPLAVLHLECCREDQSCILAHEFVPLTRQRLLEGEVGVDIVQRADVAKLFLDVLLLIVIREFLAFGLPCVLLL